MPKNQRESLIFTVIMCAFMVFFMSVYNITLHDGLSWSVFSKAWMGFPLAYIIALLCDWFIVARFAKKLAFSVVKPDSKAILKITAVSVSMVCGMVVLMSMFGAIENAGLSSPSQLLTTWLHLIPMNFVVALPLQLIVAGPTIRFTFRKAFPEGSVQ